MKKLLPTLAVLALASLANAQTTKPSAPTLTVGSPAPELKVAKWFKGTPVTQLERGKVYVVEFWATWCGPCKASMPHVTELAHKYKDQATILGISIWERPKEATEESLYSTIQTTIDQMGDRMNYNVGAEGLDKAMAETWMTPAKQPGIPCAFIVNKDGNIAWIGLPAKMDEPLAAVIAGTWDIKAEQKRLADAAAEDAVKNKYVNAIMAARRAKDPAGVLKAFDAAAKANPAFPDHPDFLSVKLEAMFSLDTDSAVNYVESLATPTGKLTKDPGWAWAVLRVLPIDYGGTGSSVKSLTAAQYQSLAKSLEAPVNAAPNMHHFGAYAALCAKAGDLPKAVTYQEKAIAAAEATPNAASLGEWIATQREKLAVYKQ